MKIGSWKEKHTFHRPFLHHRGREGALQNQKNIIPFYKFRPELNLAQYLYFELNPIKKISLNKLLKRWIGLGTFQNNIAVSCGAQ